MSLSDDLFDRLATIGTIGGPAAPRLYRRSLPQPFTLPAITFFRVDTVFEYAHDGDSELIHPRYQVSCWAATNAAANLLAREVQVLMDGWTAIHGGAALPVGQTDAESDTEVAVPQAIIDYIIWYNI